MLRGVSSHLRALRLPFLTFEERESREGHRGGRRGEGDHAPALTYVGVAFLELMSHLTSPSYTPPRPDLASRILSHPCACCISIGCRLGATYARTHAHTHTHTHTHTHRGRGCEPSVVIVCFCLAANHETCKRAGDSNPLNSAQSQRQRQDVVDVDCGDGCRPKIR